MTIFTVTAIMTKNDDLNHFFDDEKILLRR